MNAYAAKGANRVRDVSGAAAFAQASAPRRH